MMIDLNGTELDVLVRLVDEAIDGIGPEIHHTRTSEYKDDLKAQRLLLRNLHDRQATTAPITRGETASDYASAPLSTA